MVNIPSNAALVDGLLAASSNVGRIPLVTHNWNPAVQLAGYLAAQTKVQAGIAGSQATIVAVGDSTTLGFGAADNNYRPTVSYPADLAVFLSQDGIAAQADNFLGQGNNNFTVPDGRVALVGGASWGYPFVAGGPVAVTRGAGQGLTFTLAAPQTYDRVSVSYLDAGTGALVVSADGGSPLATLAMQNTGKMVTQTIALPNALHSAVSVMSTSANSSYIEGAAFSSSTAPSVQVYNAGEGGAQSVVVGDGVTPGAGEVSSSAALGANLALINFGINDILQGTLTAAQTTANIALMVTEFRANGTSPVIIIPQPIAPANYKAEIATLRADIYALSDSMNVPVIDLSATYSDNAAALLASGLLGNDGVHPSATLYADIASGIANLLTSSAPPPPPPPPPPASPPVVALSTAPSVGAGGATTLGTVSTTSNDALTVTLKSDAILAGASTLTLNHGILSYAPGAFTAAQAGADIISYTVVDPVNGTSVVQTQTVTLLAPPSPAVTLAGSPSVAAAATVVLGAAAGAGGDGLTISMDGDARIAVGSGVALVSGNIVYTPGSFTAAQAGADTISYTVHDAVTGAVTKEVQSVTLVPPLAPAVTLAGAPSVANAAKVVLGTATGVGGDGLTISMDGDAKIAAGSGIALVSGNIVYTPGNFSAAQAGPDTVSYTVHDVVTGAVTKEAQSLSLVAPLAATASPAVTMGSGPNGIVLNISEDAYLGDAQFTVSVDGTQIGGTQTATALHVKGADQVFTVDGTFSAGPHAVTVNFLNDAYAGTPQTDRNLYVDSITSSGTTVQTAAALLSAGPRSFTVGVAAPPGPVPVPPGGTGTPVTIGSGPDTLALNVSEDAYLGDAQFTVAINGAQVGGIQTATATRIAGASQTFNVEGSFTGGNQATVTFLNDANGGTPGADRNLFVNSATFNGAAITGSALAEFGPGPMSFLFQGHAATTPATSQVVLHLAEDAYQGDAQYIVSIDGGVASAPQAVTALNSAGASQAVNLGAFSAGVHDIAVSFVNDLYGGAAGLDRNLYVTGIGVNGTAAPNATAAILGDWTRHFDILVPQ